MNIYSRRDFIKTLGLGAAAMMLPERMGVSRLLARENKPPNIILIMADDLGYECDRYEIRALLFSAALHAFAS